MSVNNDSTRVYSNDSTIWLNMTRKQAEKEFYTDHVFRRINTDGDDKIDEKEFKIYNNASIIIFVNSCLEKYDGKFVYDGMKKDVAYKDEITKKMFDKLNTDGNDELSYEEIVENYANAEVKDSYKDRELEEKRDKTAKKVAKAGGIIGGLLGTILMGMVCRKSCPTRKFNFEGITNFGNNVLFTAASGTLLGCFGGGLLGKMIGKLAGNIVYTDKDWTAEKAQDIKTYLYENKGNNDYIKHQYISPEELGLEDVN